MQKLLQYSRAACLLILLLGVSTTYSNEDLIKTPCSELSRELRLPCRCALGSPEPELDGNPAIYMNCDRVVFPGDFPPMPYGAPIVSYSQRWAGHQALPTQSFANAALPLRSVDFSGNSLRRLTERFLWGLQSTLVELRLADNLLGDTLNPIFSSSEFHGLTHLQLLDLSGNSIKAIEEGILKGCDNLQVLKLDRNVLTSIPSTSINGPKALRILSLRSNRIGTIKVGAFQAQQSMEKIDLSHNYISTIEGRSLEGLEKLRILKIAHNKLTRFNSDVFQGAENLIDLDLAENFMTEFPTVALKPFTNLQYLNLSSNLIQNLDNNDLVSLVNLYSLDLSRNNIANIAPGTFLGLKQLRRLDISVNSLRTVEDDAFEGLDNLETLYIKDNNILLIPASALGRLPRLTSLQLDYNRVAAISGDILRSIAERVTRLVLSKNVVRELPPATFQYFQQLQHLDLTRNLLTTVNSDAFSGLESTLISLKLSQNRITNLIGAPLSLSQLQRLDLSDNQIIEVQRNALNLLPSLTHLNLSRNIHLQAVPNILLHRVPKLLSVDFSFIGLKVLLTELFAKSRDIKYINLSNNGLSEIPDGAFINLRNITEIDLSFNNISNIKASAFVNVMNIQKLSLRRNQLTSFKGEFFNTGTSLEVLDISENQLSYLFPSSFRIHPRLKRILASKNKFNFFPAELIATLQFLEYVDLSDNNLKTVDELDFARLPRLRVLDLSRNHLESISEMAFHNSTQLQILDLSTNKLERLGERTFEGLVRLEMLNLGENLLQDLPETIFERSRLQMLQNINLSRNKFEIAPFKSLQRQYFFISSVDLSYNKLKDIPADDSIMVNIKKMDLSFNPLSEQSIKNVLGEPKTVRELNLAGTGITTVSQLETPFLNSLNLSYNNITSLSEKVFERTTLLENLDLSHNGISELTPQIWSVLKNIQSLNFSSNPIQTIPQNAFEGLESLRYLSMKDLEYCGRIEKTAFKNLPNLFYLEAYNFPKLGYLDVAGLLQNLNSLEFVNIETKDSALGSDQIQSVLHPRLQELGVSGNRLRSISSGTLSGLKGPKVLIGLRNTSLASLPPALFFSVPRSSHVTLDVTGSQLTSLTPQMLVALDDRRGDLKIVGLETNPVTCDCGARALRRWLPAHMTKIRCSAPEYLKGKLLVEIGDDELTCDPKKPTPASTTTTGRSPSLKTRIPYRTTEPEIIWSVEPTPSKNGVKNNLNLNLKPKMPNVKTGGVASSINNDDTLIIGIVGGVVAFIAILIIIICIIRLRMTSNQYRGGPLANGTPVMGPPGGMMGPASSCACSVKGGPPMYAMPPSYGPGYAATLPHKMHNMSAAGGQGTLGSMRPAYSTLGRVPYYQNNGQPYIVAFPEEKQFR